jgi:hypothetical protein
MISWKEGERWKRGGGKRNRQRQMVSTSLHLLLSPVMCGHDQKRKVTVN